VTATALEVLLARLYGDPIEAEKFLVNRRDYALAAGLTADQLQAVLEIDAATLKFVARSYERKRGPAVRNHLGVQGSVTNQRPGRLK
jgi:hypothetical protein